MLASSSMLTPEKAAVSAGIWVTHLLLGELPWENNPQIQCTALTLPHTEVAQTCSLCLHGRQDHQQPTLQMEKLRHRKRTVQRSHSPWVIRRPGFHPYEPCHHSHHLPCTWDSLASLGTGTGGSLLFIL